MNKNKHIDYVPESNCGNINEDFLKPGNLIEEVMLDREDLRC